MITQKKIEVNEKVENFEIHKKFALNIQRLLAGMYKSKVTNNLTTKSENILNCGSSLEFRHYYDNEDTRTLERAGFCKHKLCPMCAWRYHIKQSGVLQRAFDILGKQDYYHLILTIPNIKFMTHEFLVNLREKAGVFMEKVAKSVDYFMSFEITIDKDKKYHPHFHIIYINHLDKPLTRKKIQTEWAKVANTGTNYAIGKQIKCTSNKISMELTKYILKFEDIEPNLEMLKVIDLATKGMKKICSRGEILKATKEARRIIDREKFEKMQELKLYENELEWYLWFNGTYQKQELPKGNGKELTEVA